MLYKGKEHFLKSIKELPGVKVELDKNDFPEVKWEDEEPTEVELTIKIKE